MASVTAFVVPRMVPSQSSELRDASAKVVGALRKARQAAIRSTLEVSCVFDFQAGTVIWDSARRPWKLSDTVTYELTGARSESRPGQAGGVRFFPDGSSTGGSITLTLGDLENRVDVSWLTGQVHLRVID